MAYPLGPATAATRPAYQYSFYIMSPDTSMALVERLQYGLRSEGQEKHIYGTNTYGTYIPPNAGSRGI